MLSLKGSVWLSIPMISKRQRLIMECSRHKKKRHKIRCGGEDRICLPCVRLCFHLAGSWVVESKRKRLRQEEQMGEAPDCMRLPVFFFFPVLVFFSFLAFPSLSKVSRRRWHFVIEKEALGGLD